MSQDHAVCVYITNTELENMILVYVVAGRGRVGGVLNKMIKSHATREDPDTNHRLMSELKRKYTIATA